MRRFMTWAAGLTVAASPLAVNAATFNDNLDFDVFTVNNAQSVSWFESTGEHSVTFRRTMPIASNARTVAAGDLNNSGRGDLVIGRESTSTWFESDGSSGDGMNSIGGLPFGSRIMLRIGDVDGDGLAEIWTISSNTNVTRYEYDGTGNNLSQVGGTFTNNAIALAIGDIDHNGQQDLFIGKTTGLSRYEATGADNGLTAVNTWSSAADIQSMTIGDLDGDGVADLFAVGGDGQVYWYEGPNLDLRDTFDSNATAVALADLNGNGTQTLLIGHASSAVTWWEYDANAGAAANVGGTVFGSSGVRDIVVYPVPEPASAALLGLGTLAMLKRRR